MSDADQDILSLEDEASSSFDGFTTNEVNQAQYHLRVRDVPPPTDKSKCKQKSKGKTRTDKTMEKTKGKTKKKRPIDISKLSESDIDSLRARMGLSNPEPVEVFDDSGIMDPDWPQCAQQEALPPVVPSLSPTLLDPSAQDWFEETNGEWELPKLKAPERGDPVRESLAKMLNVAFTAQCATEEVVKKYKIPSNCDKLAPPLVNTEVWAEVNKKAHSDDRTVREAQNLITAGVLPILKLAEDANLSKDTRGCLQDALLLLGQAQFSLSIRRRYLLRPHIKRTYAKLCSMNTPITTQLFGDDIAREMKRCESSIKVTRDATWGFSRGRAGFQRRGRYTPYPQQYGQYHSQASRRGFLPFRGQMRGRTRGRGRPGMSPAATITTATAPNETQ